MTDYHIPVLAKESVDGLHIDPAGVYVDLTFGGGGHSGHILSRLGKKGLLVAFDQDADAARHVPEDDRVIFIQNNFRFMRGCLRLHGIEKVNGILADLGVSSHHFDTMERGFSFRFDTRLDMRMNQRAALSAYEVVNHYDAGQLIAVFRDYGELPSPHRIAGLIMKQRQFSPIVTTGDLTEAVKSMVPKKNESKFLAKLFQSLRMEVNREADALKMMLEQSAKVLTKGGRLSVITYHSLEDRIVKNFMKTGNTEGKAETDVFGHAGAPFEMVYSKAIIPSEEEISKNPRARSAKLRVAEKK